MPFKFGSTLRDQKKPATNKTFDPVFLALTPGTKVIRILGNEIQYKVYWFEDIPTKVGDQIVPKKKPFIVGTWDNDKDMFVGTDGEYFAKCPFGEYVDSLPEEEAKKLWPKQRFVVNVLDRESGLVMVLEQSSGKKDGKHFLQTLITAGENMMSFKEAGKKLDLTEADIRIITKGTGTDTVRTVMMDINQDPYEPEELYDLESYIKPWPHEAQQAILDGAEYNETRAKYNLPLYPEKKPVNEAF